MPVPVCDRPPTDSSAIVSFLRSTDLKQSPEFLKTVESSPWSISVRDPQKTNALPGASLERARLASAANAALEDLERYSTFRSGWDGYGADPIAPNAILMSRAIVNALLMISDGTNLTDMIPGPAPDGSLDLELRNRRRRLIVTIYPGSSGRWVDMRSLRAEGDVREERTGIELADLVTDLRWLMA